MLFRSFQLILETRGLFETVLGLNTLLIVTGVEVVIGNCLPGYLASLCGASKIMGP